MKFEINLKNEDGSIAFHGTANKTEADFLMNVGVNYLLAKGAYPTLTGHREDGDGFAAEQDAPETVQ